MAGFYKDRPWEDLQNTVFEQAIRPNLTPAVRDQVLYLKSLHETEAGIQITKSIESLRSPDVQVIVDDPKESAVQSLTWYGTQVFSAYAVLCNIAGPERVGSTLHNARQALVAGMAYGMEKNLLMLAEGNFLAPIDYRDLVVNYENSSEALARLKVWQGALQADLSERRVAHRNFVSTLKLATELRGLQIGEYIAENESTRLVNDYFVETAPYRQAFESKFLVFVGRKGTGKTANFLKLADELQRDRRNLVCVVKPVAYEMQGVVDLLKRFGEADAKGFAVESMWKFLLVTEMARSYCGAMQRIPAAPLLPDDENLQELVAREERLGGDFAVRLESCIKNLIRAEYHEGEIAKSRTAISESLHKGDLPRLREILGRVLGSKQTVYVLVDNLDKAWDKKSDLDALAQFLLGLLTAAHRLATDFSHSDSRRRPVDVRLILFLRSDIFYRLMSVAREPDKIPFSRLSWSDREQLLRVIEERFMASHEGSVLPAEIWHRYFCETVNNISTKDYFVKRILPRPRDLVFFVKAAIETAVNRGHGRVAEGDVFEAEKRYSQYALESVLVEEIDFFTSLENALFEFAGSSAILTEHEIRERVEKFVADHQSDPVEVLCLLSFLGMEIRRNHFRYVEDIQDYRKVFSLARAFAKHDKRAPRYRIHPAFWAFLEISGKLD